MNHRAKRAFAVQAVVWTLILLLLPVFSARSLLEDGIVKAQKAVVHTDSDSEECEYFIKIKPSFAVDGWTINCTDAILAHEELLRYGSKSKTEELWGLTYPRADTIKISKKVSLEYFTYVIHHEWAHAYSKEYLWGTLRYKLWENFVKASFPEAGLNYKNDVDEILADNVARCNHNRSKSMIGFPLVDCQKLYEMFPEFEDSKNIQVFIG